MQELILNSFHGGISNVVEPHLLEPHFARDLTNGSIHNGAIVSAKKADPIDAVESELIYQNGDRSIIKWGGDYFWTDNLLAEGGSTHGYFGITEPGTKGSAAAGTSGYRFAEGDKYKYFFTYATPEGYRSGPYSTTDVIEFTVGSGGLGTIKITGFDDENIPDSVTTIEIWRTTANGSVFYRAGTAARYTVSGQDIIYHDRTTDSGLILKEQYDLSAIDAIPDNPKYLCERNSVFYVAQGNRVYFSKQSNPHSYPSLNYVVFDDTITALAAFEDFTMVLTRNRAYYLTGDTIADMAKYEIPDSQGVKNWKTVSRVKNMPVWISNDGLCAYQPYDNRSGRKITVLTENLFELPSTEPLSAAVANDVYYLFYEDQTIAFDFLFNLKVYRLDWLFEWAWYDKDNDRLIGKNGEVFYNADSGDQMEFTYESPEFIAGDMQRLKQFSRMHVDSDCDLTLKFYADGTLVWTWDLPKEDFDQRTEFVSSLVEGRRLKVVITGTGTLRGLKFDFVTRSL